MVPALVRAHAARGIEAIGLNDHCADNEPSGRRQGAGGTEQGGVKSHSLLRAPCPMLIGKWLICHAVLYKMR